VAPSIRRLTSEDLPAVQRILYLAIGWNDPADLPPLDVAMRHPAVALFFDGWGRRGDNGCVAELDGQFAGGAFYRLFTEGLHGDGFVAQDVPEIAVAVESELRGTGLGTRLMYELANIAHDDGVSRLSLSVNTPNPARRLYERLGYKTIEEKGSSVLMVLDLATA